MVQQYFKQLRGVVKLYAARLTAADAGLPCRLVAVVFVLYLAAIGGFTMRQGDRVMLTALPVVIYLLFKR